MATWSLYDDDVRILKSNLLRIMESRVGLKGMPDRSRSYKEQAKRELAHRLALEEQIHSMTGKYNSLLTKYEELKDAV